MLPLTQFFRFLHGRPVKQIGAMLFFSPPAQRPSSLSLTIWGSIFSLMLRTLHVDMRESVSVVVSLVVSLGPTKFSTGSVPGKNVCTCTWEGRRVSTNRIWV